MSTANSTPTDALRAHSDRIAEIVDKLGAGTVAVLGRRGAIASGAVWRVGLVVTAAHVFRRTPAALTLVDGAGASRAATLVGIDSSTDLALFRLADEDAVTPLALTEPAPVRAGRTADPTLVPGGCSWRTRGWRSAWSTTPVTKRSTAYSACSASRQTC